MSLVKHVMTVNGAAAGEGATVSGGDEVKFGIEIPNTKGTLKAEEIEVWDELPAGIDCAAIVAGSISNGGECEGKGRIVWQGVEVGPGATAGPLTCVVKVPVDVAPGHTFENEAGITQFKSETNTGEKFTYFPEENINPAAPEANTGPADDVADVVTTGAELSKTATPEGGGTEATIGQIINYSVVGTIPAGSTLYGTPAMSDIVPSNLELVAGSITFTLVGEGHLPSEFNVTNAGNVIAVNFPTTYANAAGSGADTVTLGFKARVKDIAANVRGANITNHARFIFQDKPEAVRKVELPALATTPVAEPNLVVGKTQTRAAGGIVAPGDTVNYTVTATNPTAPGHVSTAYEVALVDTIPAGMEVVTGSLTEGGTVVGKTIVWKVASIAPGATVTRTYQLKVEEPASAASTFKNEVVGTTQSLPDEGGVPPAGARTSTFTEGAYKAAEKGYESKANTSVRLVGATVSKEVAPVEGTIGTNLTYKLHMNLPPQINFFNTTVVDTLPNGIGYDAPTISAKCVKGCEGTVEGAELTPREGAGGTTLLGWYFGNELAAAPAERELLIEFEAHIEDEKNGGGKVVAGETLINHVVGLYNEAEGPEPTEVPTPGASGFSEETVDATAPTKVLEPHITLTKTASAAAGTRSGADRTGLELTYTLTVTNEGTSPAYETEVVDTPTANLHNFTPVVGAEFCHLGRGRAAGLGDPDDRRRILGDAHLYGRTHRLGSAGDRG